MKNLIPNFIQKKYQKDICDGNFDAFTMFIDISGFTQMTEALMEQGEEGAEILSQILNRVFNPIVNAIYANGGFISTFAGDAFTAIFPKEITNDAFHLFSCAQNIQSIFANDGLQQTKVGDFQLQVKIGLSYGNVDWGIVGHERKTYFFSGEGVDGCAHSEHQAEKGETIFDDSILSEVEKTNITFDDKKNGYFRLLDIAQNPKDVVPIKKVKQPQLSEKIASAFLPQNVVEYSQTGEFRNVIPIFISFQAASKETFNEFVSILMESANKFGGYFNKLDSGDKGNVAIIVFGAPKAFEDNTRRALNFILSVKQDLKNLTDIKFRAGMTYGRVYAGIVGGQKRCEYTVLGDIVNLSARFMMKADWGECWVSERIQRNTDDAYQYENLGSFSFKGKSGKIPAYRLSEKRKGIAKTFRGKFVGRSKELEFAGNKFDLLKDGKMAGVIYIYGNAGVGKSRFVYELQEKHTEFNWLHLPCDSVLKKSFNPFSHFFSNYFQQTPENSRQVNKDNFDRIYEQLIADLPGFQNLEGLKDELTRLKSIMEGFLGIHDISEDSLYNQLDAKLRYENTLYAFKEIFRALSYINPIVIELEDLHWIDDDSIEAFNVLLRNADFPMLLIVSSRYNDDHTKPVLPVDVDVLEIDLETLSDEGTIELAESILEGKIAEKLEDNLLEKTVGNPFFVEQTVYYYKETEIITFDEDKNAWELTAQKTAIPNTVNDLLIARVDRLSSKLKEAVQTASVFGHEFELNLLLEVLRQIATTWKEKDFEGLVQKGEENKVWSILSEIKAIFAHAMMRDAVYGMQLKARLRNLHKLIAETLQTFFPDDKSIYEDLAYHYERAEIKVKTMEYLLKAGDYAKDNFMNKKALALYDKLDEYYQDELGIGGDDFSEVAVDEDNRELIGEYVDLLLEGRSYILQIFGKNEVASEVSRVALELAQKLGDKDRIGRATHEVGYILVYEAKYAKSQEFLGRALKLFGKTGNNRWLATVYFNLGRLYLMTGDGQRAKNQFQQTLKIGEEINDLKRTADALGGLGIIYDYSGKSGKAIECYQEQIQIYRKLNNKIGIAQTLGNIGIVYFLSQDFDKALSYYEESLNLNQKIGNKKEIANCLCNIGLVYQEKNDHDKALDFYTRYYNISEELNDKVSVANAIANMAHIFKAKGNYKKAEEKYEKGLSMVNEIGIKYLLPEYMIEKAELFYLQKKFDQAILLNKKGLKIANELGDRNYIDKGKTLLNKINTSAKK